MVPDLPPGALIDREAVRRGGLWKFVQLAWPHLNIGHLVPGWHMELICNHLEAVSRGELKRLLITVPPGTSKSTLTSILWPAWDWIANPERRWMAASFDSDLVLEAALKCKEMVKSDWFQQRWPDVQIAPAGATRETMTLYHTTRGGMRLGVTVGSGKATGFHAHIQIVDDPTKPKEFDKDPRLAREALDRTWSWWTGTMASRRADPKSFARVIIQQRLHEDDLVGRLSHSAEWGDWALVSLPMEFDPERKCETPWGQDPRTEWGELLCPGRYDAASVAEAKRDLGSRNAAAQLQQMPAPAEGNLIKREWFRERWTKLPDDILLVQSWDCSFRDTASSDFVAGHIFGYSRGKYYLVDRIHDRMGLPETCACILSWCKKWPKAYAKIIENKANGPAIEQVLRDKVSGLIMIEPEGGKIARVNAVAPFIEAGNVILPEAAWGDEVLEEIVSFPHARHDDDVDALTQAIIYLHGKSAAKYITAMQNIKEGKLPEYFKRRAG